MENEPQIENEPLPANEEPYSWMKVVWIVGGVIVVGTVMALTGKNPQKCGCLPPGSSSSASEGATPKQFSLSGRPLLVDWGAGKCIPCKKMAPILEELKVEYAGRMDVEFIDVWKNGDAASRYGIASIPTQIFFDASGKELFRHEGFFAKEDILKKWQELGVDLTN